MYETILVIMLINIEEIKSIMIKNSFEHQILIHLHDINYFLDQTININHYLYLNTHNIEHHLDTVVSA